MWLFTKVGFFSVVQKDEQRGTELLTVRARAAGDLHALRATYLPELGGVEFLTGSDYQYRAVATRSAVARASSRIALDIDYANFKEVVSTAQGAARAHCYHRVWRALLPLAEPVPAHPAPTETHARGELTVGVRRRLAPAAGALVIRGDSVLLVSPRNHFDRYVWTFPKGRLEPGEDVAAAAVRETLEETGYAIAITAELLGGFDGGTTRTRYVVAHLVDDDESDTPREAPGVPNDEVQEVAWVPLREAAYWLGKSGNVVGRNRDLAVLRRYHTWQAAETAPHRRSAAINELIGTAAIRPLCQSDIDRTNQALTGYTVALDGDGSFYIQLGLLPDPPPRWKLPIERK